MDGHRPGALRNAAKAFRETLTDDALDRELEAALNVAPSPEFVAQVRMRVASEPVAGPWWASWRLAAAGVSAVALAIVLTVWPRPESVSPAGPGIALDRRLPAAPVVEPGVQSPTGATAVEPAPPGTTRTVAAREQAPNRRVEDPADTIVMTEVIVSADDRRSLETLLVAVQQRRLPPLTPDEGGIEEVPAPAPIELAVVTIEPVEISRLD